jgi:hypothetical protein
LITEKTDLDLRINISLAKIKGDNKFESQLITRKIFEFGNVFFMGSIAERERYESPIALVEIIKNEISS